MKSVIILPTYNERENLPGIVQEILRVAPADCGILVVDDNSPDGTGRLADELAQRHDRIDVLHRAQKQGLGRAYAAGFMHVLKNTAVQYIFEMDADYSHQPKYLPHFFQVIQSADVVLGSRYIRGGGVENWNIPRRCISKLANSTIRIILGIPISDLTGGYKCFRRQALASLDFRKLESRGYNFQIEVTYRLWQQKYRIKEIPITFLERHAGSSKFSLSIMIESFWRVILLRFSKK